MKEAKTFFEFAAEVGLTKHIGGIRATDALAALCHISEVSYVLDVGCGVGVTPCYLAGRYGCRVVGVDILPRMVDKSRERAKKLGLEDKAEFRVADAQDLPFEDNLFDAVITESVTSFPADKRRAVQEYARVIKPGGYVGLNESTWLKYPPTPEMIDWVSQDIGATVEPLQSNQWLDLLKAAGLTEIIEKVHEINVRDESRGILQRYGCGGIFGIYGRILLLYLKNPAYRKFLGEVNKVGMVPKNLDEYFGYGLYVGRKQNQS
jgi:ubiquinone/menaquinone biosynthesis C-methylase UbiE